MTHSARVPVEVYQGVRIFKDDKGFYWADGMDTDGWFDTIEECRASVESYNESFKDDDQVDRADALDTSLDPNGPWGAP